MAILGLSGYEINDLANDAHEMEYQEIYNMITKHVGNLNLDEKIKTDFLQNLNQIYTAVQRYGQLQNAITLAEKCEKEISIQLAEYPEDKELLKQATDNRKDIEDYNKGLAALQYSVDSLKSAAVILRILHEINPTHEHTNEMMKGAHVKIEDNGKLFDLLKGFDIFNDENKRASSHYKKEKGEPGMVPVLEVDYSLQAALIFKEALFGCVKDADGKEFTYFQFERHSYIDSPAPLPFHLQLVDMILKMFNYSWEKAAHILDWVEYKMTGQNIGQYGSSKHTDSKPLVINNEQNIDKVNDQGLFAAKVEEGRNNHRSPIPGF